jgi:hypothetical protein
MPDLRFQVTGAEAVASAMEPAIALNLEVRNEPSAQKISSVILRCQIQIETPRRSYSTEEQARLRDLFGEPERWNQTLKPLLWATPSVVVPAFSGQSSFSLNIPCTFDLSIAASKYFFGVEGGAVPLTLMFSGSIFYESEGGRLQAFPISWSSEARFRFPVALWKDCIDLHYPNSAWLGLRRDVFERLYAFKVEAGLASFEEAIELMMRNTLAASA